MYIIYIKVNLEKNEKQKVDFKNISQIDVIKDKGLWVSF